MKAKRLQILVIALLAMGCVAAYQKIGGDQSTTGTLTQHMTNAGWPGAPGRTWRFACSPRAIGSPSCPSVNR